jgi:hypothetical protein
MTSHGRAPIISTRLDDPKVERLLATKGVIVLATVQPDGAPLAMPTWCCSSPRPP